MMAKQVRKFWAKSALLENGWANEVKISVDVHGSICKIVTGVEPENCEIIQGTLIPGISNVHSHAHQRVMAGLAESTNTEYAQDSFWGWRKHMYQTLEKIEPDGLFAIASQLYIEMLKFGYTCVSEFQYLHHDIKGKHYQNSAEMTLQCYQAAKRVGIAFTALPVLYQYAGFGSQDASPEQKRFINNPDDYAGIVKHLQHELDTDHNATIGIAPHSLRSVSKSSLTLVLELCEDIKLVHIHIAEQQKEVTDCMQWSKQRPVQWLLNHFAVDQNWCLIHATHMNSTEMKAVTNSHAVIGLCPSTEANLGDGFFAAKAHLKQQGRISIGSDSHISISPALELRWLEYAQRLQCQKRNVLSSDQHPSVGRNLLECVCAGGAQATTRLSGKIKVGYRADFISLDDSIARLTERSEDIMLDSWIFSCDQNPVQDVFVGGEKVIDHGHHPLEQGIATQFKKTLQAFNI